MEAQLPTFHELLQETIESFETHFNAKPQVAACAPGRVNLIGEHIDYCDGFVLPMVRTWYDLRFNYAWIRRRNQLTI